jgi:hypothetical protein
MDLKKKISIYLERYLVTLELDLVFLLYISYLLYLLFIRLAGSIM